MDFDEGSSVDLVVRLTAAHTLESLVTMTPGSGEGRERRGVLGGDEIRTGASNSARRRSYNNIQITRSVGAEIEGTSVEASVVGPFNGLRKRRHQSST